MEKIIGMKYDDFKAACQKCTICYDAGIRYPNAFPLFMQKSPINTDILFIFETPNWEDTFIDSRRYLTLGPGTGPTGEFFWELFIKDLRLDINKFLFFTNSVLCLPSINNNRKYEVTSKHINYCSKWLKYIIDTFQPKIVCSIGAKALKATANIEEHNKCKNKLSDIVAEHFLWYGRILYPLFHMGLQARYWRSAELQRSDWRKLRELYNNI